VTLLESNGAFMQHHALAIAIFIIFCLGIIYKR
jgi:hypothetical protein